MLIDLTRYDGGLPWKRYTVHFARLEPEEHEGRTALEARRAAERKHPGRTITRVEERTEGDCWA